MNRSQPDRFVQKHMFVILKNHFFGFVLSWNWPWCLNIMKDSVLYMTKLLPLCVCRDVLWVLHHMTFPHPICGPLHLLSLCRSRSVFDWLRSCYKQPRKRVRWDVDPCRMYIGDKIRSMLCSYMHMGQAKIIIWWHHASYTQTMRRYIENQALDRSIWQSRQFCWDPWSNFYIRFLGWKRVCHLSALLAGLKAPVATDVRRARGRRGFKLPSCTLPHWCRVKKMFI
jgi:hypothetical protein